MLGIIARFLIALAALSPVAITWVIATSRSSGFGSEQAAVLAIGVLVAAICLLVITDASRRLTQISFSVQEVKAVDNEVVAFVVAYLFPVIAPPGTIDYVTFGFVLVILAVVLSAAHAFTFNPLLTVFGYHFYEVKSSSGVTYLLLSRNDVTDVCQVNCVGKLTNYLMLDLSKRK